MNIINMLEFRYLTENDDCSEVGRLLYQTDPYIYPAFFGCEKNAVIIMKEPT